jgi:hypothetical protein
MKEILNSIDKKLGQRNILLFSLINTQPSSDKDVYCIFSGTKKSWVEFYLDEYNIWTEVFVDNAQDVDLKLGNYDEIAINFLCEMTFYSGNYESYQFYKDLAEKIKLNFKYPSHRLWPLKYRIYNLYYKYINNLDCASREQICFLLNSLNYPLFQYILVTQNVVPSSPKKWLSQLAKILPPGDYEILTKMIFNKITLHEIQYIYQKYIGEIDGNLLIKMKNNLTFLS